MPLKALSSDSRKPDQVLTDKVDVVEVNHFYDEQGRYVFDQVIYYDWNRYEGRYDVVDWRLIKNAREELSVEEVRIKQVKLNKNKFVPAYVPKWTGSDMIPTKQANGLYKAIWSDSYQIREIVCGKVYETWTQVDPEQTERSILHKDSRKTLQRPILRNNLP